ncbi:MAG: PHA/PHB synthase family protein, partial [Rhizobiaceae bacterium]
MSDQQSGAEIIATNMERLQVLTQRLIKVLANRQPTDPKMEAPGYDFYMKAANAWMAGLVSHPEKMAEQQAQYWRDSMNNMMSAQQAMADTFAKGFGQEPNSDNAQEKRSRRDRRFSNAHWDTNPWFHFIRDQYLATSRAIAELVDSLDGLEERDRQRVEFFSRQIVDMFSPTNFLATNPEALEKALITNGKSLVDGMENLVRDLEVNQGRFAVTLSDPQAFEVGKNIASSKGEVVYRNRLFELIQYTPTTKEVFATPLVIIPPWINKFYILDLKPQNSFIRYAVDQGLTVFVVSWVNPDETYADTGFDDYVRDGALEAIETVCAITGEEQVNAIGYCIGGTLLATTLAWLAKRNRQPISNATFFTTLLDFEQPGELSVFL